MENLVQVFANSEFGKLRTIVEDDKVLFVASDAAKMLGYAKPANAVALHCRYALKRGIPHPQGKGTLEVNVISEGDLYRLITHSELPSAQKFESWIFDEVLPTIRKTGSYAVPGHSKPSKDDIQAMRAQTMAENSRNRRAKLWMQLADKTEIPEFKQLASAYAANTLAGKMVVALPEAKEKSYSATDIGNIFGISANKVGKLANKYGLKTPENGKLFYDKSRYSSKEVESFRYYESAISAFKDVMEKEKAGVAK